MPPNKSAHPVVAATIYAAPPLAITALGLALFLHWTNPEVTTGGFLILAGLESALPGLALLAHAVGLPDQEPSQSHVVSLDCGGYLAVPEEDLAIAAPTRKAARTPVGTKSAKTLHEFLYGDHRSFDSSNRPRRARRLTRIELGASSDRGRVVARRMDADPLGSSKRTIGHEVEAVPG